MRFPQSLPLLGTLLALATIGTAPVGQAAPITVTYSVDPDGDIPYKVMYFKASPPAGVIPNRQTGDAYLGVERGVVGQWSVTVPLGSPDSAYLIAEVEPEDMAGRSSVMHLSCDITSGTGAQVAVGSGPSGAKCAGARSTLSR